LSGSLAHGKKFGVLSALVVEAMTKTGEWVAASNPGNFGTYEGGKYVDCRLSD